MATKKLARTVIEGGRSNYNKFERRHSHRTERAHFRAYCAKTRDDLEAHDALWVRKRPKVYKWFNDKLGPSRRWLRSKVGTPWNEVRSEMMRTFDTRTLAGRHIVYDHMLHDVVDCDDPRGLRWSWFIIDAQGILREGVRYRRRPRHDMRRYWRLPPAVEAWCAGRRIARRGSKLFWFVPTTEPILVRGPDGRAVDRTRYRQHKCLEPRDAAAFERLPTAVRNMIVYEVIR